MIAIIRNNAQHLNIICTPLPYHYTMSSRLVEIYPIQYVFQVRCHATFLVHNDKSHHFHQKPLIFIRWTSHRVGTALVNQVIYVFLLENVHYLFPMPPKNIKNRIVPNKNHLAPGYNAKNMMAGTIRSPKSTYIPQFTSGC